MNITTTFPAETEESASFEPFYVLSSDPRIRATVTRLLSEFAYSIPLEDEYELVRSWPGKSAILLVHDLDGALGRVIEMRDERSEWLPIVAIDEAPTTVQIVDAVNAGVIDYWQLPLDPEVTAMRLARAFDYTQSNRVRLEGRARARKRLASLTPREREVFEQLSFGYTNKEIARSLGISYRTVETHRSNVKKAMAAHSAAAAVRIGLEAELD